MDTSEQSEEVTKTKNEIDSRLELESLMNILKSSDEGLKAFTKKSRREQHSTQLLVYSMMFALIVLAAYGYYLIYNVTHDIHAITNDSAITARSLNQLSLSVNANMDIIARNHLQMQVSLLRMADSITEVSARFIGNTPSLTNDSKVDYTIQLMNSICEEKSSNLLKPHELQKLETSLYLKEVCLKYNTTLSQ